jgi:uncharacterized protein YbaP (TraB family)
MVRKNRLTRVNAFLIAVCSLVFFTIQVDAQNPENSLLWKVEGNGIKPSYLFGTVHVLPQADFDLKPKVVKAFEASELLVLELDMSNPNMQMEMMQYAPMAGGHTLDQLFTQADYKVLDSIMVATVGMGLGMVNTFKPFIISSFLIGRLIDGQPASFEATLVQMAAAGEKKVVGLETVAGQMAVFDAISYESQAEDVMEMVYKEAEMKKFYQEMINLYRTEQMSALYDQTTSYVDDEKEIDLLLHNRNKNWISQIGELTREKSAFIGVGAAHLGGDEGLVKLLRDAGYTLTPVY